MKRAFSLIVVPALLVALGFAQTPAASINTDQTVKGCLGGSDGNYTVVEDSTGHILKITTNSVDFKQHLGHDVALIGHRASGASSAAADNSFAVTELNMISEHCAAAAAPIATASTPSETASTPPASAAGATPLSGSVLVLVEGAAAGAAATTGAGGEAGVLAVSAGVAAVAAVAAAAAQWSEIMVSSVTAKLLSAAAELVTLALCPIRVTSWPRCCLRSTPLLVILKVWPVLSSATV